MSDQGIKHDAEKNQLELLSPLWILGVGSVLTFGAKKYASWNWAKGLKRTRVMGAALRHIFAYLGGQDNDPESGLSHLYHASCSLMFAAHLHETRPDLDDRFKIPPHRGEMRMWTKDGMAPVNPEEFSKMLAQQQEEIDKIHNKVVKRGYLPYAGYLKIKNYLAEQQRLSEDVTFREALSRLQEELGKYPVWKQ